MNKIIVKNWKSKTLYWLWSYSVLKTKCHFDDSSFENRDFRKISPITYSPVGRSWEATRGNTNVYCLRIKTNFAEHSISAIILYFVLIRVFVQRSRVIPTLRQNIVDFHCIIYSSLPRIIQWYILNYCELISKTS